MGFGPALLREARVSQHHPVFPQPATFLSMLSARTTKTNRIIDRLLCSVVFRGHSFRQTVAFWILKQIVHLPGRNNPAHPHIESERGINGYSSFLLFSRSAIATITAPIRARTSDRRSQRTIRCIVLSPSGRPGLFPPPRIEPMSRIELQAAKVTGILFSLPRRTAFLKSIVMSGE